MTPRFRLCLRASARLAPLVALFVACSSSENDSGKGTIVGPAGGVVSLGAATLEIPPGALDREERISIREVADAPPVDTDALSRVYAFEPDGLVFRAPVGVRFTTEDSTDGEVFWTDPETSALAPLESAPVTGAVTATTTHFSRGCAVRHRCRPSAACSLGSECRRTLVACKRDRSDSIERECTCSGDRYACNIVHRACNAEAGSDGGVTDGGSDVVDAQPDAPDASVGRPGDHDLASTRRCFLVGTSLRCAGHDSAAFGDGTPDLTVDFSTPQPAATGLAIAAFSTGPTAQCALKADGSLWCWGRNEDGEAGGSDRVCSAGTTSFPCQGVPAERFAGTKFTAVSTGRFVACAIEEATKAIRCWGQPPDSGGTHPGEAALPRVHAGSWTALSVGPGGSGCAGSQNLTCALDSAKHAYCWNACNKSGGIGAGLLVTDTTYWDEPTLAVAGGHVFDSISTGAWGACAIAPDGMAWCWGASPTCNSEPAPTEPVAVPLPAGEKFVAISHGTFHICALTASSKVYCWGSNRYGALGQGTVDTGCNGDTLVPQLVTLPPIRAIDAADFGTCADAVSGARYCWGHNGYRRFGDGTMTDRPSPVIVP